MYFIEVQRIFLEAVRTVPKDRIATNSTPDVICTLAMSS